MCIPRVPPYIGAYVRVRGLLREVGADRLYTSRTSGGETACIRTKLSERAREKKRKDLLAPRETHGCSLECSTKRLQRGERRFFAFRLLAYLTRSPFCPVWTEPDIYHRFS